MTYKFQHFPEYILQILVLEENISQIYLPNWQFYLPQALWQSDKSIHDTKGLSVTDLSPHFACTPTANYIGPTWILSTPRANMGPTRLAVWAFSHPCRVVLQASSMCTRCIGSGLPATITTSAICVGWARCPSSHISSANSTSSTTLWVCIFVSSLAPGRFEWNFSNYTPGFNEVERGVYWFHVVCPSVRGQNRVCSVSSTIQ